MRRRGAGGRRGATAQAPCAQALVEQVADVIDEQRTRRRGAVLAARVPAEHEQLLRAGHRRVEQVALRREPLEVLAEQQARGLREAPALVLAENRARRAGRREEALLQAAQKQGSDPARTQREGVEHRDRALRGTHAVENLELLERACQRARVRRRELGGDPRQLAELAQRAPPRHQRASVLKLFVPEHARLPAPRGTEQPRELALGPPRERARAAPLGIAQVVDRAEAPVALLPHQPRLVRAHRPGAPHARLQPVRQAWPLEHAGRAQPREQVIRPTAALALATELCLDARVVFLRGRSGDARHAAQQDDQCRADRAVGEAPSPRQRVRDGGGREDLFEQVGGGGGGARDDRDLPRRHAALEQRPDLFRDEL